MRRCKVSHVRTTKQRSRGSIGRILTKRAILVGGGHAHLAVLADWARNPLPGAERWLVTSERYTAYSGMFPGWLAGFYREQELFIDLAPLAERAGARLVLTEVTGIDPVASVLELSNGERLSYDLVSLATGGETDVSGLAALGDRLITAKPVGAFIDRWRSLLDSIALKPGVEVAVVGAGAAGVELALAVEASLRQNFNRSRVSLIAGDDGLLAGHATGVRRLALAALRKRGIVVHHATAAGTETGLLLSDGTELSLDFVIAATGSRAPKWLGGSGLACTRDGFIEVGPDLRSRSHPRVFAAGDVVERIDRPVARSGVHAVKAGPILAANLRASLSGEALRHYVPRNRTLYLLSTADRLAILSWGRVATAGSWVWKLKDWIDRHFVEQHKVK